MLEAPDEFNTLLEQMIERILDEGKKKAVF
jgi:hypothetical protein